VRIILFFAIFFIIGCGPYRIGFSPKPNRQTRIEMEMDTWLNKHKSEALSEWGAPQRVVSDGLGGEILVWERTTYSTIYSTSYPSTGYTELFVNSSGIIYKWRRGRR